MVAQAVWTLRVLWFVLPLTLGPSAGDAIASADRAVPQVMTVGLWVLWAVALVATMVPMPATLTAVRLIVPGASLVGFWAVVDNDGSPISIVGLVHALIVGLVVMNQLVGDRFADGASYGDERRMLLRAPAQLSLVVLPVLWLLMAASVAAGPLLLADHRWVLGVTALAVGAGIIAVGTRAVHQLTRRWIVFVPTGMVLHDLSTLTEPVLFRRTAIERLGAAIAGSPARDLSKGASGLLLECELTDAAPLGLRDRTDRGAISATMTEVRRFLFCPTRPGALLDEAERRGIAVD